jgi:hypothetical protein
VLHGGFTDRLPFELRLGPDLRLCCRRVARGGGCPTHVPQADQQHTLGSLKLGEVQFGFVAVGEPDDHTGPSTDGLQVGVEG